MTIMVSKNKPHGDHTTKTFAIINSEKEREGFGWLEHLEEVLGKADMNKNNCLTWAACILHFSHLQGISQVPNDQHRTNAPSSRVCAFSVNGPTFD